MVRVHGGTRKGEPDRLVGLEVWQESAAKQGEPSHGSRVEEPDLSPVKPEPHWTV